MDEDQNHSLIKSIKWIIRANIFWWVFSIREREREMLERKEREKDKLERKGWKEVYQKARVLFFYTPTLILLFLFCFTSFTVGSCSHYRRERASRKKEKRRKKRVTSFFRSDESRTTTFPFPQICYAKYSSHTFLHGKNIFNYSNNYIL